MTLPREGHVITMLTSKDRAYYHKHDDELNKEFMKTPSGATNARG